jgi:hypothetical protein
MLLKTTDITSPTQREYKEIETKKKKVGGGLTIAKRARDNFRQ